MTSSMEELEGSKTANQVFKTNTTYFSMMRDWHERHGGLAVEPEVKALISEHCIPKHKILEAGCGEGSITNWFAKSYPTTKFMGIDISPIGAEMAGERVPDNASFFVGDLTTLPFSDSAFHFIFAHSVLEHVVGWQQAIIELYRILRPNGELLMRVGNGGTRGIKSYRALLNYFLRWNRVTPIRPSFKLEDGNFAQHQTNFDVQEIPSDILVKELKGVGFSIAFFSTRTHLFLNKSKWQHRLAARLTFWPFNHLGPTTILMVKKYR